jgi:nicotinamide riboside kinase
VQKPFIITIVGSESSGKSTLSESLAEFFHCPWIPEYAREYLTHLAQPYDWPDLMAMAQRQHEIIMEKIEHSPHSIIIIDGGMMNFRLWARLKYHLEIPVAEIALEGDITNLYLLCRPAQVWSPDPLREAPDIINRAWIFNHYLEDLVRHFRPLEIIGGKFENRVKKAIKKIEPYFPIAKISKSFH